MVCTYCGADTKVSNSRHQKRANQVWRRRQCPACKSTVTTIEAIDYSQAIRVNSPTGSLEPFQREKLLLSIYDACGHRSDPARDAQALTSTIVSKLLKDLDSPLITRDSIVQAALNVLQHFDKAAAVRYEAFHPLRTRKK